MRRIASEPIWKVGSETGLEMVAVVESVPALSKVSLWVINQMQAVSNSSAVTFDRVEKQAMELFMALEHEISISGSDKENQRKNREMQALRSAFKARSSGTRRFSSFHVL